MTEQITREVTRQLAPQATATRPSSPPTAPSGRPPRRRSSTRDIPSDPGTAGVIAPDVSGRAAGSVEFEPRPAVEPSVPPAYEAPGPYPGLPQPHPPHQAHADLDEREQSRTLGQPAPRRARWQPGGEDSGPQPGAPSWQPPLSEEPQREPPATSDAVWQAPAWLRPEERQAPAAAAPSWAPASYEPPTPTPAPTWGAPAAPATSPAPAWTPPSPQPTPQPMGAPAWTPELEPEPEPRAQRSRAPRIPELGLDAEPPSTIAAPVRREDEFVDGGFADEFDDEFDDGDDFDDEPTTRASKPAPNRRRRKPEPEPGAAALEPELGVKPMAEPVSETRATPEPPAKPGKAKADDEFDDDDDFDDFDDDDDEFDDASMAGEPAGSSVIAAPQPRKLPWVPIAAVAGALVLFSSWLLRDTLFGGDEAEGDESAELAEAEPETAVEPEPEPEPEQPKVEEPPPEPPPPAIPPEELEAKLAEAEKLVNKLKHKDAVEIVDEILEKIPQQPRALSLRAIIQMENQNYDDSLVTANECVDADPGQANCWIVIASVEQLNDNLPRALEGYRKYLELAPDGRYAKSAKLGVQQLAAKVEG